MPPYAFHPELPDACPPQEAEPVLGTVYRGVRNGRVSEDDFLSLNERKRAYPTDCDHWGLSVWVTEEAVKHAYKILIPLKKRTWSIAVGQLQPTDGLIMHTPSPTQPDHRTFWKNRNADMVRKFQITQIVE